MYGSARRGAPVLAFAQIGKESEATRSMIYYPEYLLVLDPMMPEQMDITQGLKDRGVVIWNTHKKADEAKAIFNKNLRTIGVVDATAIAVEIIGRPIPNTIMLGAFAKTTGLLEMNSIFKAIDKRFTGKVAEANKKAAQAGYDRAVVKKY
jgi:pyruvate ferredoxin oxidoreductase gamma subunit